MFDHGSFNKNKNFFTLHTEGFTVDNMKNMCEELNKKFNFNCYPMKRRLEGNYYMIYFPTKDTPTMREIMHKRSPVMLRKIPGGWDSSVDKDSV